MEDATHAWLFCPGHRAERFAKALTAADRIIIDLEDGVEDRAKAEARERVRSSRLPLERTLVRMAGSGDEAMRLDASAIRDAGILTVMVAKCEDVERVADLLPDCHLVPQIETPAAVANIEQLAAHPSVVGLGWGAEDLAVNIGALSARDETGALRPPLDLVRSRVLLAAAAHGKWALDAVLTDIDDRARTGRIARDAFTDGFAAVPCIHPLQVPTIAAAYRPRRTELVSALRVLDRSPGSGSAVTQVDGRMVDAPIRAQARRIVRGGSDS